MQGIRGPKAAWEEAFRRWGLYLLITPSGSASWRIKYRIEGKEKTYSIDNYPEVSLAAARVKLGEVKAQLREHKDPVTERRVNRAASAVCADNTFRTVAQDCLTMKQNEWSAGHYIKSARAFERDIYPTLPARELLPRKKDPGRMPALLDFPYLGDMLRRAETGPSHPLGAHGTSFVRPTTNTVTKDAEEFADAFPLRVNYR